MNPHTPQLTEAFKLKGYLDKKSTQKLLGWQRRYWVVVGVDLLYFQDQSQKDLKGKFPIRKIQSLQQEDKRVFSFVHDDRKYELKAQNEEERNLWLKGLKALKRYAGDEKPSEPNSPIKLPNAKSSSSLRDISDVLSVPEDTYITIGSQMYQCKGHSDVLRLIGLGEISSKFSSKKISSRVAIIQIKEGYLFVLSCKSLTTEYEDGQIWSQQQVNPFDLNALYRCKFGSDKVKLVCKTSAIFSVDYDEGEKLLKINCGKRKEYATKQNGKEFQKKLKKAVDIGREYHNSKNISLNANIAPLLKIYETESGDECIQKVKIYLESKYSDFLKSCRRNHSDISSFSEFFTSLVSFEKDYLNAFEVSSTKNPSMVSDFEQFMHLKIHRVLTEFWDQKHQTLTPEDILTLARIADEYRKTTIKYAKDPILDDGIGTLVKIYLKSTKQKLLAFIQKLRGSLSFTSFSDEVYNFLHRQLFNVISNAQSRQALTQIVQFLDDCYKIWIQQLYAITQKQTNPENIAAVLTEINEFNSRVFTQMKSMILNNGLDALAFDDSLDETEIIAGQKNLTLHIIQRMFKLLFANIDRDLISRKLMDVDLEKLILEIDSKVEGLKNISDESMREVRREIANELIQFELNLILQHRPAPKQKIDSILKKLADDKNIIEKQFLVAYDKETTERQLAILVDILEFLRLDSIISTRKHFQSMKRALPHLFTLVTAKNLLELKTHLSKQDKSKLYAVCVDVLSSDAEKVEPENTMKESLLESYTITSRRSTLTLSLQRKNSLRQMAPQSQKETISGYLKKKKVDKRSIKRIYERRYFTILEGHLLWYLNESSVELHNKIDLKELKLVALHESKKDVFFLHLDGCVYQFKAESEKSCKEWVRILKTYVSAEQAESEAVTIHDNAELFKDYGVNNSKPMKIRMQSTRESVLSQLSDKERSKDRRSPSPSASPPKSPTKSVLSQPTTERNSPLLKKEVLSIEKKEGVSETRGCWAWLRNCMNLQ